MTKIFLSVLIFIATNTSAHAEEFESKQNISCEYSLKVPDYVPTEFEVGHKANSKKVAIRYTEEGSHKIVQTVDPKRPHSISVENSAGEDSDTYITIFNLDSLNDLLSDHVFAITVAGSWFNLNGDFEAYHAVCYTYTQK